MNIFTNDHLKTAFISYPKSGSNTLKEYLCPHFDHNRVFEYEWRDWSATNGQLNDPNTLFSDTLKRIPQDYTVYAFCREPVDRWLSAFVFVLQTNFNLFYSDISNVKKNIANAPDKFYKKFFSSILKLNNYEATLGDMHFGRQLYPLLLLKTQYKNMHLVDVNEMNKIVCEVNESEYIHKDKANALDTAYAPGFENTQGLEENIDWLKIINSRFRELFQAELSKPWFQDQKNTDDVNMVRKYLHMEKLIYNRFVERKEQDAMDFIERQFPQHDRWIKENCLKEYKLTHLDLYRGTTLEFLSACPNSILQKILKTPR